MKNNVGLFVLLYLFLFFNSFAQDTKNEDLLRGFHSISSHEIPNFADTLTADKYKGRLSGSPGYLEAARWCAGKLEEWGILPAGNGSYFQYFPNAFTEVYSSGSFTYTLNGKNETECTFPEDYFP